MPSHLPNGKSYRHPGNGYRGGKKNIKALGLNPPISAPQYMLSMLSSRKPFPNLRTRRGIPRKWRRSSARCWWCSPIHKVHNANFTASLGISHDPQHITDKQKIQGQGATIDHIHNGIFVISPLLFLNTCLICVVACLNIFLPLNSEILVLPLSCKGGKILLSDTVYEKITPLFSDKFEIIIPGSMVCSTDVKLHVFCHMAFPIYFIWYA